MVYHCLQTIIGQLVRAFNADAHGMFQCVFTHPATESVDFTQLLYHRPCHPCTSSLHWYIPIGLADSVHHTFQGWVILHPTLSASSSMRHYRIAWFLIPIPGKSILILIGGRSFSRSLLNSLRLRVHVYGMSQTCPYDFFKNQNSGFLNVQVTEWVNGFLWIILGLYLLIESSLPDTSAFATRAHQPPAC